jgi:hypothetical protein
VVVVRVAEMPKVVVGAKALEMRLQVRDQELVDQVPDRVAAGAAALAVVDVAHVSFQERTQFA